MTQLTRRRLRRAFGLVLLVAIVVLVGPARLARTLGSARPLPLGIGALVYATMVAVKAGRWRWIVRTEGPAIPPREVARAFGLGMLLGAVTPGRVGQHVKAYAAAARGASTEGALATTVVDQVLDSLVMAALVPLAVAYFGHSLSGSAWLGLASLLLAAVAMAVAGRLLRDRLGPFVGAALRLGRRSLGLPLLLTVISTGLYLVTLSLVGRAVGLGVPDLTVALASVASAVVELAPVSVAGLGTREAALLGLLGPLGVAPAAVVAFTLIVRAMQICTGGLAYTIGRDAPGARPPAGAGAPG